jgi:hypothetical protein
MVTPEHLMPTFQDILYLDHGGKHAHMLRWAASQNFALH